MMPKDGDRVRVNNPKARHNHTRGWEGHVEAVSRDKASRDIVVTVRFLGGIGHFDPDELEKKA